MNTINMISKAHIVKGHGVLSAHDEQVGLVKAELDHKFKVYENSKRGCDINHYHSINPELFFTVPFMKRKGKTVGYVHFLPETVENSIQLPKWMKKIFYKYMITFYKSMDYLVTVNPYFIDVLERYGVDRKNVTYIPNFVSDKAFYPLPAAEKRHLRKKYGLCEERFTVLCVGQMQKRKGIFEFIKIAEQMPEIQFLWAGNFAFGKISDGYEEIKQKIENLPSNIKLLGLVEREKMNDIYNIADVMFLPSFEELFPMTILESMNCKIPVLVRELDIYEPILFDFAVRGKDNEHFKEILSKLKCDKRFYQKWADRSYAGHLYYSREHVKSMWEQYYGVIINECEMAGGQ